MKKIKFTFVSLFLENFRPMVFCSILKKAISLGLIIYNERKITSKAKNRNTDDAPYGGNCGQLIKAESVINAIKKAKLSNGESCRIIITSPAGKIFSSNDAKRLSKYNHIIVVCGRYEGIDSRIEYFADESISIGDYVITGGEAAALVIFDAVSRNIPGVIGKTMALEEETHSSDLLEYRQYTRPRKVKNYAVPGGLTSGNHKKIILSKKKDQLIRTRMIRRDLWIKWQGGKTGLI